MTHQDQFLQKMKDNFQKLIEPHKLLQLDEHMPILNNELQPIGYFNHRCYDELLQLLKKTDESSRTLIGLS